MKYFLNFYKKNSPKYHILIIFTDGDLNDYDQTIKELINICRLPLSIIIVGIGEGDFEKMEKLIFNYFKILIC